MKKIECVTCHSNDMSFYKASKGYLCADCRSSEELAECMHCDGAATNLVANEFPVCDACANYILGNGNSGNNLATVLELHPSLVKLGYNTADIVAMATGGSV